MSATSEPRDSSPRSQSKGDPSQSAAAPVKVHKTDIKLAAPSTLVSVPTRPSDSTAAQAEERRSRPSQRHSSEDQHSAIVLVPLRSPSVYSRPPSDLFNPEDVSPQPNRELPRWFTDVESSQPPRRSRSRSRGARDGTEAYHFYRDFKDHRYASFARSPLPEAYARRYYASRGLSDSRPRSPYIDSGRYMARWHHTALSSPVLLRQSPARSRPTPSAALGAPPQDRSPLEPADPPLYLPDLTKKESSVDSTDHESEDSDSNHLMGPKRSYS
ncbi:UNVERIFIED_CONTAM: hypothetical protein K2H54_050022 [Gekko kuhli]